MKTTAIIEGRAINRSKVYAAIAECDRLGRVAFLDRYGYRRSRRWVLRANGRSYPSKAIVGVAAGLKPSEFFGGVRGAAAALRTLGFEVRAAEVDGGSVKLDCVRRLLTNRGLSVREPDWPRHAVIPGACFASGSNQAAQVRAMAAAGADIGVAAPRVSKATERELHKLAGTDVQVFVDSGAFSEVDFGPAGRVVVKPLTDEHWQRVLGLYERLAATLGSQLWFVAPDCVGDQATTLKRLRRYRDRLDAIRAHGARMLLPVQKGRVTQAGFTQLADRIVGGEWIPALPCRKAATTADEVAAFVATARPRRVHLLGLGIRNRHLDAYLDAVGTSTAVTLDASWLAANTGRTRKTDRRLTRARDAALAFLSAAAITTVSHIEASVYACLAGSGLVAS